MKRIRDAVDQESLIQYIAYSSVGSSTTQGYKRKRKTFSYGEFLKEQIISWRDNPNLSFEQWLSDSTVALAQQIDVKYGAGYKSTWGVARKILNIFLHNLYFNHSCRKYLRLHKVERLLEVPLDSHVAGWIARVSDEIGREFDSPFKEGFRVHRVTEKTNNVMQEEAVYVAEAMKTKRVFLDVYFYRADYVYIYT